MLCHSILTNIEITVEVYSHVLYVHIPFQRIKFHIFLCYLNAVLIEMELEVKDVWPWEKPSKSTRHCRH